MIASWIVTVAEGVVFAVGDKEWMCMREESWRRSLS